MWPAWRMARATMVRVGFSEVAVVNWLPSETNRLATSWAWPQPLTTPSFGSALIRQVPMLWAAETA